MSTFFQIVVSNVTISLILAGIALIVGMIIKRPRLVHLLWLIVLVKLLTPSILTLPIVPISQSSNYSINIIENQTPQQLNFIDKTSESNSSITWFSKLANFSSELGIVWLIGSMMVLTISIIRIYRFNRLINQESKIAPNELQKSAVTIANRLNLKKVPSIYVIYANFSPMVWWIGGKIRIIIPFTLTKQMNTHDLQLILAHELAHVKRRDYMVRWIEWFACIGFWWNPVVYWARYNLRNNEELCCDAMVISSLTSKPDTYAHSLLNAFEALSSPVHTSPVIASEIGRSGFLERRFKIILSGSLMRKTSGWILGTIITCSILMLSLGIGCEKVPNNNLDSIKTKQAFADQSERNNNNSPDCIEVIFPVSFLLPDGSKITVENNDGYKNLQFWMQSWHENNPNSTEQPSLQYPVQISYNGDSTITINNADEMNRAKQACTNNSYND